MADNNNTPSPADMPETPAVEPHDAPESTPNVEPLLNEASLDKAAVTQTNSPKPEAPRSGSSKVDVKGKAEQASEDAKAKAEDVADDAKETAAKAQAKAEDVADKAADKAKDAADKAKDAADNAGEKIQDAASKVAAKAEELVDDAKAKVAEVSDKVGENADEKGNEEPRRQGTVEPKFQTVKAIPNLKDINRKIFASALPGIGSTPSAKADPTSALEVRGVTIDQKNLADYTSATGLRLGNQVPPTYFFVLSFPLIMDLMTKPDFPYAAMGSVHMANVIEQKRWIEVDETLNIRTWSENLRPHRKGLLLDFITEITPEGENEPVWRQVSTMLGQGAKFAKDAALEVTTRGEDNGKILPKPELPEFKANAQWRWTRDDIRAYVDASNDHNPIHTSNIGAKLFGFPSVIAHGMYSTASVLAPLEGKLPGALRYSVEFVKPVLIPGKVALWTIDEGNGTWDIQLRNSSKPEKLHLNGRVESL